MDYKIDAGDFVEWKNPFTDDVEFRRVISVLKIESTLEVERERSKYMLQLEPKEFGCRTDFIYSNEIIAHYKRVEKTVLKANCEVSAEDAQRGILEDAQRGILKAAEIFKEARSTPIAYL